MSSLFNNPNLLSRVFANVQKRLPAVRGGAQVGVGREPHFLLALRLTDDIRWHPPE
jgi:hypothetical protein